MTKVSISATEVNQLRKMTGAGLMDCKKALVETNGDRDEAVKILKKKGAATAAKRAGQEASEGLVTSYIHGNRIGVLLEINCETDFVAKNDDFKQLARDLCMHIAAAGPLYLNAESIPAELLEQEKELARSQCEGKPEAAIESIIKGKLNKWYSQVCLMQQNYVKDQDKTIQEVVTESIARMGENIVINRFSRFEIGA